MRKITFKINKDMETYIKPALKVLKLDAEEIMDDDFIHYSGGDNNQLSKENIFNDEEEPNDSYPRVSVWDD